MRQLFLIAFTVEFFACNQKKDNTQLLEKRIDSLQIKLAATYKPGFGEFMSQIQAHHAKLWFAGENENWKLADFEVHEIMELVEDIQKFQTERKESRQIEMINPALNEINKAIQQKNLVLFKSNFTLLTNTCNDCHRATNFEFNVVKIPDIQPFSNQDFKMNERK
ncbi:MAG: hypothetical protein ABI315_08270 [Bacteroidia bacterium]